MRLAVRLRQWYEAGLTPRVEREAARCLVNAAAAGIGGSRDPAVSALITAGLQARGTGRSPILGRTQRLPPDAAASVNAFAVTQNDFDDAHAATIVHPGAAALAGVLSAAPRTDVPGRRWLAAFALACEIQLSVATALSPSHYERGWHSTSTCAAVGSAVATGLVLGLDEGQLALALELAMLRVVGLRAAHGTLMKGYQVGRAAANGVQAANAVAQGCGARLPGLLGVHEGFTSGLTDEPAPQVGLPAAGDDAWELRQLTYKPYPAGIVCSGGIEAALALAAAVDPTVIDAVTLRVHPLVVELAGDQDPADEMQARVSLPHAVAAALLDGAAGVPQFAAARVNDPAVRRLRRQVTMAAEPGLGRAAAILEVHTPDGQLTHRVDEPHGGTTSPLTDSELRVKVRGLVDAVEPGASDALLRAVAELAEAPGIADLISAIRLERGRS